MRALLTFVERICGRHTRASVFEPLVADWQRELDGASGFDRYWTWARGSAAFMFTAVICLFTGGVLMPRVAVLKGLAALLISTTVMLGLQMLLNSAGFPLDFPLELQMWRALPMVLPFAIPMAMLPAMLLLRGHGQTTARSLGICLVAGALASYLAAGLSPLLHGDVRDSLYEQMNQRALANDRAGRFQYPGTAYRQLRPTTLEQRLKFREDPRYLAARAEMTRPRWGRSALMSAALSASLGLLGWALGARRRATIAPAIAWWAIAWLGLLIMGGRLSYWVNGGIVRIGNPPEWLPLSAFTIAAVVLSIAERFTGSTPRPSGSSPTAPAGAASHR